MSFLMLKLFLKRYRFHIAVNRRDQLSKVGNGAVHKTKQETVSTCRMAEHLGMQTNSQMAKLKSQLCPQ